jgi:hypothetical protein
MFSLAPLIVAVLFFQIAWFIDRGGQSGRATLLASAPSISFGPPAPAWRWRRRALRHARPWSACALEALYAELDSLVRIVLSLGLGAVARTARRLDRPRLRLARRHREGS